MFTKKNTPATTHDLQNLLNEIDRLAGGDYSPVDEKLFSNRICADKLNNLISSLKQSNNDYIMRLNSVLADLSDFDIIKHMIENMDTQTSSINSMKSSGNNLGISIEHIFQLIASVQQNTNDMLISSQTSSKNMYSSIDIVNNSTKQITEINSAIQHFQDKIDKISDIVDMVKNIAQQSNLLAINASIEAAHAGEAGKGFAVVADEVRNLSQNTTSSASDIVSYVSQLKNDINNLANSMNNTCSHLNKGTDMVSKSLNDIENIYNQLSQLNNSVTSICNDAENQSSITKDFTRQVDLMSDNYTSLYQHCIDFSSHIYKDSRYIDKTRSHMIKGFSCVTLLDKLHIFKTDHFILLWRVYGNIIGLEHLLLKQVNKPDNCKLGKWLSSVDDTIITNSQEFAQIKEAHLKYHDCATNSFKAMENGDSKLAIEYFEKTRECYEVMAHSIDGLILYLKRNGNTKESITLQLELGVKNS